MPTLRRIFTLDHPGFVCDPVVVKMDRDHYWINGSIETRDRRKAGAFTRHLVRHRFAWTAVHDAFAVEPAFRRRGIAYSHYRKVLRGYRRLGCYRVELFAQDYGVFVWPQFGFRYVRADDRKDVAERLDRLHRARTGCPIPFVPQREWELIVVRSRSGEPLGARAAEQAALWHPNGALEMVLDLRDRESLEQLVARGIFQAEEIR
ncbi:MAG TPA: GNAT family N-acetyltransferase [Candidatus Elarobacter sp.]|nr:GNAT family N-acetyltransferase [Candidatus Elarobacter sp.]